MVLSSIVIIFKQQPPSIRQVGYFWDYPRSAKSTESIDVQSIEHCVHQLKLNKAAGHDGLVAEHVLNSHPSIIVHLKFLFTMILDHSYVPNAFSHGLIIPVIKDKHGDVSAVDNYRPITLSPVLSKVLESYLMLKYSHLLWSDDLQFGFKKKLGCNSAIFMLRNIANHFSKRKSMYILHP